MILHSAFYIFLPPPHGYHFATKGWMTTTCAGSCGILLPLHGDVPFGHGFQWIWAFFLLVIRSNLLRLTLTPPKFNMFAPEKWWLEGYFPIRKVTFQGLC